MRCKSGQNEKQYHEDCYIDNFFTAICPWVYISAIFYCTIFGMYGSNRLNTKKNMAFTEIALIVLLYFSISPGHFPFLFQSLERMRFMILQNQYENEAEVILKNYLEDVDYQMIEGCNWMLTSHGTVNYQRKEENAVIFFITDYTEVSGYVYYSNQTAFDWMKNCAQIENINDHWMMVQMYE